MKGVESILQTMALLQLETTYPPLSKGVIHALGPTVLLSPGVFESDVMLDVNGLSYFLIGYNSVIHTAVTGAVLFAEVHLMVDMFAFLGAQPGWLNRALIVIVDVDYNLLAFREFWCRRTSNVLYHTPVGLYAYNPFTELVFRVEDESQVQVVLKKRWKNMMGCPVMIDIVSHTLGYLEGQPIKLGAGLDASALRELQKYWNMTIVPYKSYDFEEGDPLETSNKHLLAGKTDIGMNARFMIKAEQVYLEYTTTVFADSVILVMRKPEKLRGWDVFIRIMQWQVWLAILITIIIMDRFLMISSDKSRRYNLTLILRTMFAIPVRKTPDRTSERMMVGCALYISTVIINLYTARLYHIIRSGQTYPSPQTLLEIKELGVPLLGTRKGLEEYFDMRENPEVKSMGSRIMVEKNISNELLQNNVYVVRENEMRLFLDSNVIRRDLNFVTEKVLSFTMAYVVKRGSPFLEPLSHFTSRAFEAGLHQWWYTMTVVTYRNLHSKDISNASPGQDSKRLQISDIEVAFFCLFAGQLISFTVFLMEIFAKHIARRRFRFTISILEKIVDLCPQDRPTYMA